MAYLFLGEDFFGYAVFNKITFIQKRRLIGNARGLLHIMSHNHNGVALFEFADQFLNFASRNWIKS